MIDKLWIYVNLDRSYPPKKHNVDLGLNIYKHNIWTCIRIFCMWIIDLESNIRETI